MEAVGVKQAGEAIRNYNSLQEVLGANADSSTRNQVVAEEFESVFLHKILIKFDSTVNREENILYAGAAEDMYRNMMYQELAKSMSRNGGIGIADMLIEELEKEQGDGTASGSK